MKILIACLVLVSTSAFADDFCSDWFNAGIRHFNTGQSEYNSAADIINSISEYDDDETACSKLDTATRGFGWSQAAFQDSKDAFDVAIIHCDPANDAIASRNRGIAIEYGSLAYKAKTEYLDVFNQFCR